MFDVKILDSMAEVLNLLAQHFILASIISMQTSILLRVCRGVSFPSPKYYVIQSAFLSITPYQEVGFYAAIFCGCMITHSGYTIKYSTNSPKEDI